MSFTVAGADRFLAGGPEEMQVLRWGNAGLWGATDDGSLYRRDDYGPGWSLVRRFDGEVEALLLQEQVAHVAVAGIGIYRTDDAGQSWSMVYESPDPAS